MDQDHPKHNPLGHAVQDAPGYTLAGAALAAALLGGLS